MKKNTFFILFVFVTFIVTNCFSQAPNNDTTLTIDMQALQKPASELNQKYIVSINSAKTTYNILLNNIDKKAIPHYFIYTSNNSGKINFTLKNNSALANFSNIFSGGISNITMILFDNTKGGIEKGKLCEFKLTNTGNNNKKPIPTINYLKLGDSLYKTNEFIMGLRALSKFDFKLCPQDDTLDPCNSSDTYRNRIRYDGKNNQIHFYDRKGDEYVTYRGLPTVGSSTQLNCINNIHVRAGDPLTFEIYNINPDDYSVQITDTTVIYYQQTNAILSQLLGSIPSISASATSVGQENGEGAITLTLQDKLRAGLLYVADQISQLLIKVEYSGDNIFFNNIKIKRNAKKLVDDFLNQQYLKPYGQSIESFMAGNLTNSKKDSILSKNVASVYNQLPTAMYRMERYMLVPKNMDKITFSFNIMAKPNMPYVSKTNKYQIDAFITNCWKVDVSAGFYYAPNMTSQNYSLAPDSVVGKNAKGTADSVTSRGNKLVNENLGNGELGIQGLVHFSYKFSPNFSAGFHIGAGLNITDFITPRYFVGVSALFGREWGRVALNGGFAMGNVQQLSNIYTQTSSGYADLPSSITTVQYVKRFMTKPYLGITYSIPFGLGNQTANVSPSASTGGGSGSGGGGQ